MPFLLMMEFLSQKISQALLLLHKLKYACFVAKINRFIRLSILFIELLIFCWKKFVIFEIIILPYWLHQLIKLFCIIFLNLNDLIIFIIIPTFIPFDKTTIDWSAGTSRSESCQNRAINKILNSKYICKSKS